MLSWVPAPIKVGRVFKWIRKLLHPKLLTEADCILALSGNQPQLQPWQQNQSRPVPTPTPQPTTEITTRVQMFNANLMPAPPIPPENIVTEQDKQAQMLYEQWLNHQNNILSQQLQYYDTEVQKLRKSRKVSY